MLPPLPVLPARTRVETAAHARRAGDTTFFRHHAMTARTGAGILAVASLDARRRAPRLAASASDDRARCPPRPHGCSLVTGGDQVRCGCDCSLLLLLLLLFMEKERESARAEAELRVLVR